jgi:FAD synthase
MGIIMGYACANISGAKDTSGTSRTVYYLDADWSDKCIKGFSKVGLSNMANRKNQVCLEDK